MSPGDVVGKVVGRRDALVTTRVVLQGIDAVESERGFRCDPVRSRPMRVNPNVTTFTRPELRTAGVDRSAALAVIEELRRGNIAGILGEDFVLRRRRASVPRTDTV